MTAARKAKRPFERGEIFVRPLRPDLVFQLAVQPFDGIGRRRGCGCFRNTGGIGGHANSILAVGRSSRSAFFCSFIVFGGSRALGI